MTRKFNVYNIGDLKAGHHVALLYRSEEEHRAAVIPYLRKGLELGEKVLYIVDSHSPETIVDYLRDNGLVIEQYLASGQFSVIQSDDAYMKNGLFDPHRVIDTLWDQRGRALSNGFVSLRITSEMSWIARNPEHFEQFCIYEAELNRFFPSRPGYGNCLAICQYDLDAFPAELLLKMISTHPLVITGKTVCENYHYQSPDDFLSTDQALRQLNQQLENLLEQRREDERLQKSEEQYKSIFDNAPYGIQLYNHRQKLQLANRACLDIFGVNDFSLLEGFNLLQNFNLTNKVLEKTGDGQTVHFETTIDFSRINFLNLVDCKKSGTMYLDIIVTEIISGIKGFSGGFLVCIQDITRRKKREQLLRKSEDRVRSVTEVVSDAIITCDTSGKVVSWNNGAEFIFGYISEEMVGEPVINVISNEYRTDFTATLTQLGVTGKSISGNNSYEYPCVRKGRIDFPGELTISRWKNGSSYFFTIIIRDISERKKTETDLRMKESAVSASINPIALLDLQSNITWVNISFLKTWGYDSEAEVIGRPATSFWQSPATALRILTTIPGKGWIGELEARRSDDSRFPVQLSSTIVSDSNNRPNYVIASFVDLSSRQNSAPDTGSQPQLLHFFDAADEIVTVWNAGFKLVDFNQAARTWFRPELPRENILGSDLFSVFITLDKKTWLCKLQEVLKTGKELKITNVLSPGKETKKSTVTLVVQKYSDGLSILASDRAVLEHELEERIEQTTCLSSISEIIRTAGANDGTWRAIAEAAVKLVRYPDKAGVCIIIGDDEYRTERFGNFPWKIASIIHSGGKEAGRIELSYNTSLPARDNGPFSRAECQSLSIAASLAAAYLPVSQQVHSPQQLDAGNTDSSQGIHTVMSMVREIKTRLTPILSSSDLLASELYDEPWKEIALSINRGALKLDEKINAMLDIARIESGTLPMEHEMILMSELIAGTVQSIDPVLSAYNQTLYIDVPNKLPAIYGDRKRLRQVLLSFLETAVKITPEGKTISIRARKSNGALDIEVRDPSPGLTDEQVRLLEQSHPAPVGSEPLSGLGFGLSLSRKLIELHNGTMWIRNVKGKGNTFGCSLPLNKNLNREGNLDENTCHRR